MKLAALVVLVVSAALAVTSGLAAAKQHHPAACSAAARIASLPRLKLGAGLRADVNGDGKRDAVSIRFDKLAPARCAFYLRVATAKRAYTLALGKLIGGLFGKLEWNAPVDWSDHAGTPVIEAIVDLGGPGNLIALLDNEGASDEFLDFVGLSHGRLRVVRMGLDLGGSVMSVKGASCSRGGALRHFEVFSAWSKKHPHRWGLWIDTYRRHGWQFTTVAHKTAYGSEKTMWQAARRAGIPSKSLVGCSLARSPDFGN